MVHPCAFINGVLQVFLLRTLQVQAAAVTPFISGSVDPTANGFVIWSVVGRTLVVDDDHDNGTSVSHKVMQAMVVVLVLFLLFLLALFLFRKHRIRRLRQWPLHPNLRVVSATRTGDGSSTLMSEIPPTPPPPALSKSTYRAEGKHRGAHSSRLSQL